MDILFSNPFFFPLCHLSSRLGKQSWGRKGLRRWAISRETAMVTPSSALPPVLFIPLYNAIIKKWFPKYKIFASFNNRTDTQCLNLLGRGTIQIPLETLKNIHNLKKPKTKSSVRNIRRSKTNFKGLSGFLKKILFIYF